ncbi:hypothetical protein C2U36_26745, partial [Escherichia coli]
SYNWFYEVRGKLQESGQVLAPVEGKPDYQALAALFALSLPMAGIVVAGQAFCNAITPAILQLVL